MSLTVAEVVVANQSLDRIGSKNFTLAVQTGNEGVKCNTNYSQTRDVVLRSFEWPFAKDRKSLSQETNTPDFEWDYKYKLPTDFHRLVKNHTTGDTTDTTDRQDIEGDYLLSNYDEADIVYIKKVTDPADFDPLFTEVLILTLAKKLITALAGTKNPTLVEDVKNDLKIAIATARTVCRAETNVSGRSDWNLARYSSGRV